MVAGFFHHSRLDWPMVLPLEDPVVDPSKEHHALSSRLGSGVRPVVYPSICNIMEKEPKKGIRAYRF